MTYEEAIQFVESVSWLGGRRGLHRVEELMRKLGDPQKHLKFVHVAGTNGKGSACAMTASILEQAGYRTGLYVSPHLVRYNERISVNGKDCSDEAFANLAARVCAETEDMAEKPSEFETLTAMALLYFFEQHCDIVVLEVGLGGRIDATNIIPAPEAALIMNIGLEHTEYLGNTVEQIAKEKAGVIKPGCDVAAYDVCESVTDVYKHICKERDAHLHMADFSALKAEESGLFGQKFSYKSFRHLELRLVGEHQLKNAAVVLETVECLRKRGWKISDEAVHVGMKFAKWPARLEILSETPLFLLDGAHNPQCAETLAESLRTLFAGKRIVFLTGVLKDKAYDEIMGAVMPYAAQFVCLTPDSQRALPAKDLAAWFHAQGKKAVAAADVEEGIALAKEAAGPDGIVVCFGSLYLAGAVRAALKP